MALTYEIVDRSTDQPTVVATGLTEEQARSELKRLRKEAMKLNEVRVPDGPPIVVQDGTEERIEQPMTLESVPLAGELGRPRQYDIRPDYTDPAEETVPPLFAILDPNGEEIVFGTDDEQDFKKALRRFVKEGAQALFIAPDTKKLRKWMEDAIAEFPVPEPEPLPEPPTITATEAPDDVELNADETERRFVWKFEVKSALPAEVTVLLNNEVRDRVTVTDGELPDMFAEELGIGRWQVQVLVENRGGSDATTLQELEVTAPEPETDDGAGPAPVEVPEGMSDSAAQSRLKEMLGFDDKTVKRMVKS